MNAMLTNYINYLVGLRLTPGKYLSKSDTCVIEIVGPFSSFVIFIVPLETK